MLRNIRIIKYITMEINLIIILIFSYLINLNNAILLYIYIITLMGVRSNNLRIKEKYNNYNYIKY